MHKSDRRSAIDKYNRLLRTWLVFGVVVFVLVACWSGTTESTLDITKKVTLDDFPSDVGQGYPFAQLIAGNGSSPTLQSGTPAPDFAMVLENGNHLSLSDLRGRSVVINFWATWCGPCRLEMPELLRVTYADADLVLLAINVQEAQDQVEPFANDFAMKTPVVLDPEGVLKDLFAVRGLPTTFFIDKSGTIRAISPGVLTPATLQERLSTIR